MLKDYSDFAKTVLRNRESVVIAFFSDIVVNGIGASIDEVNRRFGTKFIPPTNSKEEIAWVNEQVRMFNATQEGGDLNKLSIPGHAKSAKAEEVRSLIKRVAFRELKKAEDLYDAVLALNS